MSRSIWQNCCPQYRSFVSCLQKQQPNARWLGSGLCNRNVPLHWASGISEISKRNFCWMESACGVPRLIGLTGLQLFLKVNVMIFYWLTTNFRCIFRWFTLRKRNNRQLSYHFTSLIDNVIMKRRRKRKYRRGDSGDRWRRGTIEKWWWRKRETRRRKRREDKENRVVVERQ